jgi:hypothetical protein
MTQELVIGVLLAGLVGLIWGVTVSILATDHPVRKNLEAGTSSEQTDDRSPGKTASKHHMIAA